MSERRQRIADAITVMAEAFRQKVTTATLRAYDIGLEGMEPEVIERAVAKAIRTCRFMPAVAELRELAGEASPADAAIQAWVEVERAVAKFGAYRAVDFRGLPNGEAINAAIRSLGGWPALCDKSAEEFDKWARQDFIKAYQSFARAGVSDEAGAPLQGLEQSGDVRSVDGTIGHYERRKPALIGGDVAVIGIDGKHKRSDDLPRIPFKTVEP